jgi:hypothetical protein
MPARAVHEHDDEEIREFLGYMKAPFILGQDHDRARVLRVSLLEDGLDLLGEVFLNAPCSAALACGWRGRGTSLRH